jgi:hypothetical protein
VFNAAVLTIVALVGSVVGGQQPSGTRRDNSAKTLEEVAAFYTNMFASNPDPVQLTARDEIDMVAYLKLLR